jgi:hypothetical protein
MFRHRGLIGTQQHILWQLETSYKTGLKAITAEGGAVVTFPFSVKTDGTPIGPVKVLTGRQAPPEGATVLDADRALSACIAAATHGSSVEVEFYRVFRPRSVMIEQPPPSSPHMQDYLYVVAGMRELGYSTTQKVVNCADHGDGTCRRRWFLLCLRNKGAIRWPEPLAVFKMPASVLDDPKTVCLGRYVPKGAARFVPRQPGHNRPEPTKARKLGYHTVAGVHDDRSLRVYDPLYPLPSATSTMSMRHLGSPGGLVRNFCGDYQVSGRPSPNCRDRGGRKPGT